MNILKKNLVLVVTALSLTTAYGCRLVGSKSGGGDGNSGAAAGAGSDSKGNSSPKLAKSDESSRTASSNSRIQILPQNTSELATLIGTCASPLKLEAKMAYLQDTNKMATWFSHCANATSFPTQYADIVNFATNCFTAEAAVTDAVLSAENLGDALEACTWSKISRSDVTPTKMLVVNIVDPSQLRAISKFRSCCGHDYSEGANAFPDLTMGESDRSMKHYLYPTSFYQTTDRLEVFAPCHGTIKSISDSEQTLACYGNATRGKEIKLSCTERPDVTIRIFHVGNLTKNRGDAIHAGDLLGYADLRSCDGNVQTDPNQVDRFPFDVAVEVASGQLNPSIKSSYFDWLSDNAFDAWPGQLGIRDDASISKSARDSDTCSTDAKGNFTGANACVMGVAGHLDDRVFF